MEIVININENIYHRLVNGFANEDDAYLLEQLFKNGRVLPKGHGDLIDRKALGIAPIDSTDLPTEGCLMTYLAEDVDGAPAIIEADKEKEE